MKRNSFITLGILSMFMLYACKSDSQGKTNLGVEEFEKGIQKDKIQVLDVRTQAEYNSGHLKNAFLADWTNQTVFQERVKYLDKNKPVYTYCLVGGRSAAAANWMKQNGFKEVYNLDGGINSWKRNEKPLEGVQLARQITMDEYLKSIPVDRTVLVDVGAPWCPPCKVMEPVIRELQDSNKGLFQLVNIDGGEQETLSKALGAESFPYFIVYKNGKETWRKQGVIESKELLAQLK
jgi:rhodanese-related sulfurtransferase